MDSVAPPRRLSFIGSWSALVGQGWPSYVRVLHPAIRKGQEGKPVTWREIAPEGIDLTTADWFGVSGVRLHTGKSGSGWDFEPQVGPGDPWVSPSLFRHLLKDAIGACWLGYWTGYGQDRPEGARELVVGGGIRTYDVVPLTSALRTALVAEGDVLPTYPDIAWDEGESFLLVSDIDLPSTIIGCTTMVAQRICADPSLETLLVDPTAPIVD